MAKAKTKVNNTTPAITQSHFRRPALRQEAEITSVNLITADKGGMRGRRWAKQAVTNNA